MAEHNTCHLGHVWPVDESADAQSTCPVCGSPSRADTSVGSPRPDELPPLPWSSPGAGIASVPGSEVRAAILPQVDGYDVLAELGRGGMGVVYRARQRDLDRTVALKMLLSGEIADERERGRFRREAEAVAQLLHPNIVQVYGVGEQGGRAFFAMEYVDGPNLAQALVRRPLAAGTAAALVEKLARAVQAAHENGIVHRDLKPANVLLQVRAGSGHPGADDRRYWDQLIPKITDFGLAKRDDDATATRTGALVGTPSYMAPEQAAGSRQAIGPRCDVYALGAILYECLTGRPPFRAASPLETAQQVIHDDPVSPSGLHAGLPKDLETICLKCLQKEPSKRYDSAADLADDLGRFARGEAVQARPIGSLERAAKWVRRRPAVAAAWAIGLTAAVALAAVLGISNVQLGRERDAAERAFDETLAAVNKHFTFVSEDLLLNAPHMEPIRRRLLQEARDYYERFVDERAGDPRLRAELGRAYARLGSITQQIGEKAGARQLFHRAIQVLDPLMQQNARSDDLETLAQSWIHLGHIAAGLGELQPASEAFQNALDVCAQWRENDESSAACWQLTGQARHGQGEIARISGQSEAADQGFRAALAAHQAAVDADPDNLLFQRDLAHTQHNLAVVAQFAGQAEQAEQGYQQALAMRQRLAEDHPTIPQFQSALAATLMNLGGLYYGAGQIEKIEPLWARVAAIQEALARTFPDVVQYQLELAEAASNLGSLQLALGRNDEALAKFAGALQIRQALADRFPGEPEHKNGLALMHNNLGAVYGQTGAMDKAESEFQLATKAREELVHDFPAIAQYQFDLGRNYINLAQVCGDRGDRDGSALWYDKAQNTFQALLQREPQHAPAKEMLAHISASRKQAEEANEAK